MSTGTTQFEPGVQADDRQPHAADVPGHGCERPLCQLCLRRAEPGDIDRGERRDSGVGLLASYGYDGAGRLQSLIQSLAGTAAVPDPDELVVTGPARDTIQPPAKDFGALSGSFSGPSSRSASNGEANSTGGFPGNKPSRHSVPPPPKGKPSYLCRVGTTAQSAASGLGRAAFASVLAGSIPNPLSPELLFLGAGFGTAASAIDALGFVLEHPTC